MVTSTEELQLPERRVMEGAALLADQVLGYGSKPCNVYAELLLAGVSSDRFLETEREAAAKQSPRTRSRWS